MIRVNLLPARVSKTKQAGRQQLAILVGAVILTLAGNFVWNHGRASELADREAKARRMRAEIAQLDRIIGEVKTIKAEQAAVRDKLAVLEKLKAGRQGPVRVLDELATVIPRKLWLRKLDEKGGVVTFEGGADSIDDVSAFLSALKRSQYFSNPELKRTSAKPEGKQKLVDFTIIAAVNYTPAAQVHVAAVTVAGGPSDKR